MYLWIFMDNFKIWVFEPYLSGAQGLLLVRFERPYKVQEMKPGLPCVKQVPACCPIALAPIQWFFFFFNIWWWLWNKNRTVRRFPFYCSLTSVSCGIPGGEVWDSKTRLKEKGMSKIPSRECRGRGRWVKEGGMRTYRHEKMALNT